jgi:uncharacterized protein YjbI with pentapeptide repeats
LTESWPNFISGQREDFRLWLESGLRWAKLEKTDLSEADLIGANLSGARYDRNTVWPEDFNPQGVSAVLVEE